MKKSTSKGMRKAFVEDTLLVNVVQRYFKLAGFASVVWAVGYFKFSVSWLWLLLVVYVWKEKHTRAKRYRKHISQDIARDEREVILARVGDLPSWVHFPDVERAEWVNKILSQMWPYIGEMVEKILRESVEKSIIQSLPATLQSFKFTKIDLGDIPPRFGGVKVYTQVKRDEIYMDLELNYSSDSNIEVSIKGMCAGIKNLRIHGTLRIVFRPLINRMPLIGGMLIFFLNNPELDFDLTSLANALDLPGLSDMLYSSVQEQIANLMVLPNRYPIKMVDGLDLNRLRFPQPQGVVRIRVIEAKDLIRADIGFTGKGKSDPYCKIRVGAKQVKTKVIYNSLNPVWDESFELIVDSADGQLLYIDMFDEDPGIMHDELGSISLDLSQLKEVGFEDEWLPLEDVKHGMIHVQLTWLWLANQSNELDRMIKKVVDGLEDDDIVHVAILLVYLDSASNLPRAKRTLNEPCPQAILSVGQQTEQSMIKYNTSEPRWEQNFRFMLHNPNYQNLDVEIIDSKSKKLMGHTVIKLKQLLVSEDMVMDQKFRIKTTSPESYLQMRLCLRVLTPNFNVDFIDDVETLITEATVTGTPVDQKRGDSIPALFPTPLPVEFGTSVDGPDTHYVSTAQQTETVKTTNGTASAANGTSLIKDKVIYSESDIEESKISDTKAISPGKHGMGRIKMTFRYSSQNETLIILIHKCVHLKPVAKDSKTMADPYVKLCLLPDKSSTSKRQTKTIKNTLNPDFDEKCEYILPQSDIFRRHLWVNVKNGTKIFSLKKTDMGHTLLDLRTLNVTNTVTKWFDLCPENRVKLISV